MADPVDDLLKKVDKLTKSLDTASKKMDEFAEGIDNKTLDKFTEAAKKALKSTNDLGIGIANRVKDFRQLAKVTKSLEEQLEELDDAEVKHLKTLTKLANEQSKRALDAKQEAREAIEAGKKQREEITKVIEVADKFANELKATGKTLLKFSSLLSEVGTDVKKSLSFGSLGDTIKERLGGAAKSTLTWSTALGAASDALKLAYKDLIGVTNLGLGATFFEIRMSAIRFGMTLEQMTEVIQKNRSTINLLGGGIEGVRKFQNVLTEGLSANANLVNRLGQRGATQALGDFTSSLQSMGVTVRDQNFGQALKGASDTFLTMNAMFGTQADEFTKHMKALVADESVQRRLIGMSKQEINLYNTHLMQMTKELSLRGLSLQQIEAFNTKLENTFDPTKSKASQRIREAQGFRLAAAQMSAMGENIDMAAVERATQLMSQPGGMRTDEGKELAKQLGPAMAKAQANLAGRASDFGLIGIDQLNTFMEMAGASGKPIFEFGHQAELAATRQQDLTKVYGEQLDAVVKSNEEMAKVPEAVAKARTAIEQIEAALNPALTTAVKALSVFTAALLTNAMRIGGAGGVGGAAGKLAGAGRVLGGVGAAAMGGYAAGELLNEHTPIQDWIRSAVGDGQKIDLNKPPSATELAAARQKRLERQGSAGTSPAAQTPSQGAATSSAIGGTDKRAWNAAVNASKKTGIPAEVMMAQYGLESGWGKHMPQGSNNPFGIKARPGEPYVTAMTKEFIGGKMVDMPQNFRKFGSLEEAFVAHGELMQGKRYAGVRAAKTPQEIASALGSSGYATDPAYGSKILATMQSQQFAAMTGGTAGAPGSSIAPAPPTVASSTSTPAAATTPTGNPHLSELQKQTGLLATIAGKIGSTPPAYAQNRKSSSEAAVG